MMYFGPFRFDPVSADLWRGDTLVPLSVKARVILNYLVAHAGQPVLKDVLMQAAWPDTHVEDDNLKVYIRSLRMALGDNARRPHYIETLPRLGYRFVAGVNSELAHVDDHTVLVGRERILTRLRASLKRASAGTSAFMLVTGELGIGKTALCERFLMELPPDRVWVARGQCVDATAPVEPYYPILDALADLSRDADQSVVDAFRRSAPTWLVRLYGVPLGSSTSASTATRVEAPARTMAAELGALFTALTVDRPLVLFLEDLQWCDRPTLNVLRALARLQRSMRLLFIGTCRSSIGGDDHERAITVRKRLGVTRTTELVLSRLTLENVNRYLKELFRNDQVASTLDGVLHQITFGLPLALSTSVRYLTDARMLLPANGQWLPAVSAAEISRQLLTMLNPANPALMS